MLKPNGILFISKFIFNKDYLPKIVNNLNINNIKAKLLYNCKKYYSNVIK